MTEKDDDRNLIKKDRTVTHTDYEGTKSPIDFMKYNFNYDNSELSTPMSTYEESITAIGISSDEYGLIKVKDEIKETLFKKIWGRNDLGINERQRKWLSFIYKT